MKVPTVMHSLLCDFLGMSFPYFSQQVPCACQKSGQFWVAKSNPRPGGGGIRLVHGHTKNTLITYFSGMKIDPKYAFLHAFFLICPSCPFQNLSIWPKKHLFFPILHSFAPLNDVRAYSAWSWKTTLITWIFGRAWYPPWHSNGPLGT